MTLRWRLMALGWAQQPRLFHLLKLLFSVGVTAATALAGVAIWSTALSATDDGRADTGVFIGESLTAEDVALPFLCTLTHFVSLRIRCAFNIRQNTINTSVPSDAANVIKVETISAENCSRGHAQAMVGIDPRQLGLPRYLHHCAQFILSNRTIRIPDVTVSCGFRPLKKSITTWIKFWHIFFKWSYWAVRIIELFIDPGIMVTLFPINPLVVLLEFLVSQSHILSPILICAQCEALSPQIPEPLTATSGAMTGQLNVYFIQQCLWIFVTEGPAWVQALHIGISLVRAAWCWLDVPSSLIIPQETTEHVVGCLEGEVLHEIYLAVPWSGGRVAVKSSSYIDQGTFAVFFPRFASQM